MPLKSAKVSLITGTLTIDNVIKKKKKVCVGGEIGFHLAEEQENLQP